MKKFIIGVVVVGILTLIGINLYADAMEELGELKFTHLD